MQGIGSLDSLRQDVSYAIRGMRRTPAFTLAAVLTLALGVGVNTAVFTVVHAVALNPLSFPAADRLVISPLCSLGRCRPGRSLVPIRSKPFDRRAAVQRRQEDRTLTGCAARSSSSKW